MSADLRLELDRLDFELHEPVTGRVTLTVAKARTCQVRVETAWHTTGKGADEGEVVDEQSVFSGPLEPGVHTWAFELSPIDGPCTYKGTNMTLDWQVLARAEGSSKLGSKAVAAFTVVPQHAPTDETMPVIVGTIDQELAADVGANMILAGIGVAMFLTGLAIATVNAIFGIGAMMMGTALMVPLVARKPFEKVELTFEPNRIRAGSKLHWRVSYSPKPNVVVNGATVFFECREIVSTGHRHGSTHYQEVLFKHEVPLPEGALDFNGIFETAPPFTLALKYHQVMWTVGLRVDLERRVDFRESTEFIVLPAPTTPALEPWDEQIW